MAEINDLNVTDASNTARFPENQLPSTVNNGARALEGIIARWDKDTNASLSAGGSANAITISANQTLSAYYDGLVIAFEAGATNTGAVTINVDSVGVKSLKKNVTEDISVGEIISGQKVIAIYDGTNFQIVSAFSDTTETSLAAEWASKTDGIVASSDYSSKAYAIGGTGVTDTAGKGAAKEWATAAEDDLVDGSEYSAKHYSIKSNASAVASAASAATAAASETAAAASETAAGVSETNAAASAVAAAANNGGVFVSANDTTAGNLESKVLASGLIGLSTQNDGANETFTVDVPIASQAQAEAGTDTATAMTPQRVSQAIAALAVSGATTAEKSNIMLNSFRIEEQGGLTVQAMVDGVSDVFTDQSGVDTATSTDETYNAAGDYYENPASVTTLSASGEWNGAALTFTGDGISGTSGDKAIRTNDSFTGDFSVTWTSPSFDGAWTVGTCGTSLDGSFNSASYSGGVFYENVVSPAISVRNNTATTLDLYANGTLLTTIAYAFDDVLIFARTGSTFTLTQNASLVYTWAYTSSAEMRLLFCKNSVVSVENFSWTIPATVLNSVIVSDTFTALSQPDTAFVAIWHEDVDACTPNTDFTVEVSRDSGSTWTAGTLALAATLGAAEILTCSVDISGQPAGTSMRWRFKFLNTKSQRLRGVGLQWS
jgi:hypothetical protein